MSRSQAEYQFVAPIVGGVTFDGEHLWIGCVNPGEGATLAKVDRASGKILQQAPSDGGAGNAWDGRHLWQAAKTGIQCLDPKNLKVMREIPLPDGLAVSGLSWDGEALWAGAFASKVLYKIDPDSGKILKKLQSDRLVTGITWVGRELWHAVARDEENSEVYLRNIDADSGKVKTEHKVSHTISGLAHDGESFWCGDCGEGKLRSLQLPKS